MPEKVFVNERATVTAGLAKLVSIPCLFNTRNAKGLGFPVGNDLVEKPH